MPGCFAIFRWGIVALAALWFGLCAVAGAPLRDGGIDPANLGKGDWIYFMSAATNKLGGNVPSVTNENSLMLFYKSQGIRYFIVKAATSDYLFKGSYAFPQFTSNLVNIAHAHGLLIFGYNRSYGSNVTGEIAISDYVFNQGADGFVWDAEAEWESSQPWITNGPAQAWALCSVVRSNWPTKFLAHAPFPIISVHSSFPYKEFGYWSDTVMPQIYHFSNTGLRQSVSAMINWSDVNWNSWQNSLIGSNNLVGGVTIHWTNAIKPLAPVHDVYGPTYASPHPNDDVMEFMDYLSADPNAATPGGYAGVNYWRTDLHGPAQWAHIKTATSGGFPGLVNNIVMDDTGTTGAGLWTAVRTFAATQTTPNFYGATGTDTNSFGTNYWVKTQGNGSAYRQFTPSIITAGSYKVYEWHPYRSDASTNVPFVITHNGGSTTVYANQRTNSGNWSFLGQFTFAQGAGGNIRIRDDFSEAGAVALADGLKLVFVAPITPPAAPAALAATTVSSSQINLHWPDTATNETAYIVGRSTVSGGPYADVAALAFGSTNYSNTGLASNTTYYYVVRATNGLGVNSSAQATATTIGSGTLPAVTLQPQSQVVRVGTNVTFTVMATGSPSLSYQWRFNGANLAGAVSNSYSISAVQPSHAGDYRVVVSNASGSATSAVATLTVTSPPALFNVAAVAGGRAAIVMWQSTNAGSSQVEFGFTTNYGFITPDDPSPATIHSVLLGGLVSGTNYYFGVISRNGTNVARSDGWSFSTVGELILDNTDATYSGTWTAGTSSTDKFGADYRYATVNTNGSTASAIYTPLIATRGKYDVFIWYPQGGNRTTNAQITVYHSGGNVTTRVNQEAGGGGWRQVGTNLAFMPGTNGFVRVSNFASDEGQIVMADAVRLVYRADQDTPAGPTVPDWWAFHYFGANASALVDNDSDGYANWAEYLVGTVPTNAASRLGFSLAPASDGAFRANFAPLSGGRVYQLQQKLEPAGCLALTNLAVAGTNGIGWFTITNGQEEVRVLRLKVDWAP